MSYGWGKASKSKADDKLKSMCPTKHERKGTIMGRRMGPMLLVAVIVTLCGTVSALAGVVLSTDETSVLRGGCQVVKTCICDVDVWCDGQPENIKCDGVACPPFGNCQNNTQYAEKITKIREYQGGTSTCGSKTNCGRIKDCDCRYKLILLWECYTTNEDAGWGDDYMKCTPKQT